MARYLEYADPRFVDQSLWDGVGERAGMQLRDMLANGVAASEGDLQVSMKDLAHKVAALIPEVLADLLPPEILNTLRDYGYPPGICTWIHYFLMEHMLCEAFKI